MRVRRTWLAVAPALLLGACGTPPPSRVLPCEPDAPSQAKAGTDGKTKTATLSVLTYNIEGLGWPARSGRTEQLRKISERLSALRAAGKAPDIVMFQEVFSGAAKRAVGSTGYPAIVHGPRRTNSSAHAVKDRMPGRSNLKRGEWGIHLIGSGIVIASRYPIVDSLSQPYGRKSCAGIDCLANKGIMLARVTIPGVPTPIDLYNTHMNSRGASRAPARRNLAAHDRQSLEASGFIDRTHDDAYPVIFGGDFNMRHSQERWDGFTRYQSLKLVHRVCVDAASGCDVRMSWDGDEPWMDTQDLQFFWPGDQVAIRPIRVEAMFDGGQSGPRLSDHDGFLVTYELRWPATVPARSVCTGISARR